MKTLKLNQNQNELIETFVLRQSDQKADQILVDMIASEVRNRLREQSLKGKSGWFGPNCTNEDLLRRLEKNLKKGDMLDVVILAAMIKARNMLFGESA